MSKRRRSKGEGAALAEQRECNDDLHQKAGRLEPRQCGSFKVIHGKDKDILVFELTSRVSFSCRIKITRSILAHNVEGWPGPQEVHGQALVRQD